MVLFRRYMLRVANTIAIVNQVEKTRASYGAREHGLETDCKYNVLV